MCTDSHDSEGSIEPLGDSLTSEAFRDVMGSFASGVTVITTRADGIAAGATASAVSSLSLEPPMLLICLNRQSETCQAISTAGRFAVNILDEDHPDIAIKFASKEGDKFAGLRVRAGRGGIPILADSLATIECRVTDEVFGGTHSVFIATVESASAEQRPPLAYFRGQFGRLSLEQDEAAVGELRRRVLHRELPIGSTLDLDRLAEELAVPRGSVHHALTTLAVEGWVDRPNSGTFVVPAITLESLKDSVSAMYAVWLGMVHLAINHATADDYATLRGLLEPLADPAMPGWQASNFIRARSDFFRYFIGLTGSQSILESWARADARALIALYWSGDTAPEAEEYLAIHHGFVKVVDAFEQRDVAATVAAILDLKDFVFALFERGSFASS